MNCSMPGFPVLHYFPEFVQTHVHWVCDAIQSFHPLSLPSSLALNLSQHQSLFQWVSFLHQVGRVGNFSSASVLPMNIQGWFPCYPRDSQESSPAPQLKGINSSALATQPSFWSNSHIHANTIALTIRTFVSIMMSLFLNMLSRFVIAFLPRSKHI